MKVTDRDREEAKRLEDKLLDGMPYRNEITIDFIRDVSICLAKARQEGMEEKITGETSDGYHTFNELYEHRVLLWINLCLKEEKKCYLVEEHYEGWFLLGMQTQFGQISYHCPNKYLSLLSNIKRHHPEFDGHTSSDVIQRLKRLTCLNEPQSPTPTKGHEEIADKLAEKIVFFESPHPEEMGAFASHKIAKALASLEAEVIERCARIAQEFGEESNCCEPCECHSDLYGSKNVGVAKAIRQQKGM